MRLGAPRGAVPALFSLPGEAELGDDARRRRIVAEMAGRQIGEAAGLERVQDQDAHRFARIAHPPIRLADPIAELGMVVAEGAIAGAADQCARPLDHEHDAFLAGDGAGEPLGGHLLAIGMRDRAGHAGDVEIAGEQADPRRIRKERQPQYESWRSDAHGRKLHAPTRAGERAEA